MSSKSGSSLPYFGCALCSNATIYTFGSLTIISPFREGDQSPRPMSRHLSSPADLDAPTTPDDKEDGGRPSQLSITLGAVVEDAVSSHERQRQYKKASSLPPGMPSTISRHFANYPPRSIKAMGSDRALATIADTGSQSPL